MIDVDRVPTAAQSKSKPPLVKQSVERHPLVAVGQTL